MKGLRVQNTTVELEEGQRQMTLLALAKLAIERPGWVWALEQIALLMDDPEPDGKPYMFGEFRKIHAPAGEEVER
jgi:hypothetical protein